MYNSTTFSNVPNSSSNVEEGFSESLYKEWIATEVLTYIMFVLFLYLTVALSVYQCRWGVGYLNPQPTEDRYTFIMNISMMASCLFGVIRTFASLDAIWGRGTKLNCIYVKRVKVISAVLAYGALFFTFWIRQRIFYHTPCLQHLVSASYSMFSKAMLPVSLFLYVGSMVFFVFTGTYVAAPPNGCLSAYSHKWEVAGYYLLGTTTVLVQIVLIGLLIYPLVKNNNSSARREGDNSALVLAKRVVLMTGLTFAAYLLSILLVITVRRPVDDLPVLVLDVSLSFAIICLIFTFLDWRKRFFPFAIAYSAGKQADVL